MKKGRQILILLFYLLVCNQSFAQNDTVFQKCAKYLKLPFVSDGQQYKAIVKNGEEAEFNSIFYGGSIYRIIGCSEFSDGIVSVKIKDIQNNILYDNQEFKNAPYWDFKFMNTMDCKIEAKVSTKSKNAGHVILMIGFRP